MTTSGDLDTLDGFFLSFFFAPLVVLLRSYSLMQQCYPQLHLSSSFSLAHFISVVAVAVAAALVPDCGLLLPMLQHLLDHASTI